MANGVMLPGSIKNEDRAEPCKNALTSNPFRTMGGDIKYRDVNGDGKITDLDKVPI